MGCCNIGHTRRMNKIELFFLVDCNNFYVSCERVFNPVLLGKPVIVLSNNDGCVISRSNEAKHIGIPMGAPLHTCQSLCKQHQIQILSSNYALYGDMSQRVMSILKSECQTVEIYSIDEAFFKLSCSSIEKAELFAHYLRHKIKQWTGIPVSIGIAKTKTLAKMANQIAKTQTSQGIFSLIETNCIEAVLDSFRIQDIWGVGRQWAEQLQLLNLHTAKQLRDSDARVLRRRFSVVIERIIYELRAISCLKIEDITPKRSICASRSFGHLITTVSSLEEAISEYAARACQKLRAQNSKAQAFSIFLRTNKFRRQDPQHHDSLYIPLIYPSHDTRLIISLARGAIRQLFRTGYAYKKAGIVLHELTNENIQQQDLIHSADAQKTNQSTQLMHLMDLTNQRFGRRTLFILGQGTKQPWQMKSEKRSPRYTSNWNELPIAYAN